MDEESGDDTQCLHNAGKKENGRVTSGSRKSTADFTYEHFPVVCPTCQGTGSIEEDASHMVSFLSVKDKRLRPAWTKSKIAALIAVIVLIGGLCTFFLYPRAVTIQINAHSIISYDFLTSTSPWIEYSFVLNVSNPNFFTVTLKQLTMQMMYVQVIVSNRTFHKDYDVHMRSVKKDVVMMNASYDLKSVGRYIKNECYINRNYVPQLMVSFAQLSYWMHTQHIQSKDDYFYTPCDSMIFPLPIIVTTSTPSTSTKATTKKTTLTKSIELKTTPMNFFSRIFSQTYSSSLKVDRT